MAPKPYQGDTTEVMAAAAVGDEPDDIGLNLNNNNFMTDKSPLKPQRRISRRDLYDNIKNVSPIAVKPISGKSLSSGTTTGSKKKKKKKKSVDPLSAASNHSVGDGSSKRRKKKGDKKKDSKKKKKKKDPLSQSDHTPLSKSMTAKDNGEDEEELSLPLNDMSQDKKNPLKLPSKRRRRKVVPSRHGSLKRNNSLPTLTGSDSDGDSTMEGSWKGVSQSFSNLNEYEGEEGRGGRKHKQKTSKKVPSEIEAFLDQIIIDASKPKSPITSIRKKALRGRSRRKQNKANNNDDYDDNDDDDEDYPQRPKSESFLTSLEDSDDNDDESPLAKPARKRCNSEADRVVSLSIAGEEKTFTLSGSDIGVIEAFLQNKSKENNNSSKQSSPSRSQDSGKKKKKRTTSASRAAKRAELFQDDLLSKSSRTNGSDKRRSLSTSRRKEQEIALLGAAVQRRSLSNSRRREDRASSSSLSKGVVVKKRRSLSTPKRVEDFGSLVGVTIQRRSLSTSRRSDRADELLHSGRMDFGHQKASMLPQPKEGNNLSRFDRQQQNRYGHLRRMSGDGERQRHRSLSGERKSPKWHDNLDNRLSLLELDTISDEGSYTLTRSISRRWSLSDSLSSSHHLQRLHDEKNKGKNRFSKKEVEINGPFNVVRGPRGGRRPSTPEQTLGMDSSDDGELFIEDVPKQRRSSKEKKLGKVGEMELNDQGKRQSRAGGKKPKKKNSVPKTLLVNDEEEGHEEIYDSPGILRPVARRVKVKVHTDDEASNIDNSYKGQTLENLMMSPRLQNDDSARTPSRQQRQTKPRANKVSTPNGAHMYTLDLGEARWTTTPTRHLRGKDRTQADPLDLHLPFPEENGIHPNGNLKRDTLGLVEPSTFRNSVIRNKNRIARKGPEEGDILVCDEDNATVVSDITEAFDLSIRSTLSTSFRSSTVDHDDYDEPLRDKWEPNIEKITENHNSYSELSAASPSDLKEERGKEEEVDGETEPATPGGTKRFTWMKKLPFSKKK